MKILKKLLPIATIASTIGVVAPTISSCSKAVFSTGDIDFIPYYQHEKSVEQLTHEAIALDYFSKTQYFMDDLVYHRLSNLGKWVEEQIKPYKDDPNFSNASASCLLSINSINIKDSVTKRLIHGNEGDFYAYGSVMDIGLSFHSAYQYTYNIPSEGLGEGVDKEVDTIWYEEDYSIDIHNCFTYLYYTGFEWNVGLYLDKELDWNYTTHSAHNNKWEYRITKSGVEEVSVGNSNTGNNSNDSRGIEPDNYAEVLEDNFYGTIVSYYLDKVSPKDEINE